MMRLKLWMRAVGVFYLFQAVLAALVRGRVITVAPSDTNARAAAGDAMAKAVVDAWVTFGLEFAAIGAALLFFSWKAEQAKALVWAVIAIEVVRGIVGDTYLISRGHPLVGMVIRIIIHTGIIVTGLLFLREARSTSEA
ncbi:MAG TPA: BphX family protein [Gemmatimonadaceae bacterium]|jgi:hypothetical protein